MAEESMEGGPSRDPGLREKVFPKEIEYIRSRWGRIYRGREADGNRRPPEGRGSDRPSLDNRLVGLAFSGGGIRSATFNLGVAQALHKRGVFDHVDYLSTVSGGGYLGSSISTIMRDNEVGFPFEKLDGDQESAYVTWLRNHSNYLVQGGFLDYLRLFAILLRGILINFLIVLPLLLLFGLAIDLYYGGSPGPLDKGILTRWERQHDRIDRLETKREELAAKDQTLAPYEERRLALGLKLREVYRLTPWVFAGLFFYFVVYPVVIRVFKVMRHEVSSRPRAPDSDEPPVEESSVATRDAYELSFAKALGLLAVVAGVETIPIVLHWFHHLRGEGIVRGVTASLAGGGSVIALTLLGRLMKYFKGIFQTLIMVVIGLLGFILPLIVVLHVAEGLQYDWEPLQLDFWGWTLLAWVIGLILGGLAAIFTARRTVSLEERGLTKLRTGLVGAAFVVGLGLLPYLLGEFRAAPATGGASALTVLNWILGILVAFTVTTFLDWKWDRWDPDHEKGGKRLWTSLAGGLAAGIVAFLVFGTLPRDVGLDPGWWVLILAVAIWAFCYLSVDVNLTSVHGLYRDRLASAYLVGVDLDQPRRPRPLEQVDIDRIDIEEDLDLHKVCGEKSLAPYYLVNTALNLQGSASPEVRERNADFFVFSKEFVGGHRTGYSSTRVLEAVFPQMDLATAMAISAAAAAPNMGKGTSRSFVALMALLNVRLGYWVPNPKWLNAWAKSTKNPLDPTSLWRRFIWRIPPRAFLSEMLSNLNEDDRWVNLSDGGHLENLATYELLRRRCKYIITGDAEADPKQVFGGLADLKRFASIDLGIEIEILLDDVRLKEGEDGKTYSHQHCAFGLIHYPDEEEPGYLLYIKQSVTGDEDEAIRQYRAKNAEFPHESTADQFFSEGQFEAYRALGYHAADGLFEGEPNSKMSFETFEGWFNELKANLAPRREAERLFLELQGELSRIRDYLQEPEFESYFYELHPELEKPAGADQALSPEKQAARERSLLFLVGEQLRLMENVYHQLDLERPRNQRHEGNQGWMSLFKRWSSTESFRRAYQASIHMHSRSFQEFCEGALKLDPAARPT